MECTLLLFISLGLLWFNVNTELLLLADDVPVILPAKRAQSEYNNKGKHDIDRGSDNIYIDVVLVAIEYR